MWHWRENIFLVTNSAGTSFHRMKIFKSDFFTCTVSACKPTSFGAPWNILPKWEYWFKALHGSITLYSNISKQWWICSRRKIHDSTTAECSIPLFQTAKLDKGSVPLREEVTNIQQSTVHTRYAGTIKIKRAHTKKYALISANLSYPYLSYRTVW